MENTNEGAAWMRVPITADELAALRRFKECADDGEGYDVPKEMMRRLAEIGLLNRKSGNYFQPTEFGMAVLEGGAPHSDPLAAANAGGLPPLPNMKWIIRPQDDGTNRGFYGYDQDQMRQYALDAIAHRAPATSAAGQTATVSYSLLPDMTYSMDGIPVGSPGWHARSGWNSAVIHLGDRLRPAAADAEGVSQRTEFESCKKLKDFNFTRDSRGAYISAATRGGWKAWQEALTNRASATSAAAQRPSVGEIWHVRYQGAKALSAVVVKEVTGKTVCVSDADRQNGSHLRYTWDGLEFVERVGDRAAAKGAAGLEGGAA